LHELLCWILHFEHGLVVMYYLSNWNVHVKHGLLGVHCLLGRGICKPDGFRLFVGLLSLPFGCLLI
jgi:hypothetical protein